MNTKTTNSIQELYHAPECCELQFYEDAAVCNTSFANDNITPGTGVDWGVI